MSKYLNKTWGMAVAICLAFSAQAAHAGLDKTAADILGVSPAFVGASDNGTRICRTTCEATITSAGDGLFYWWVTSPLEPLNDGSHSSGSGGIFPVSEEELPSVLLKGCKAFANNICLQQPVWGCDAVMFTGGTALSRPLRVNCN